MREARAAPEVWLDVQGGLGMGTSARIIWLAMVISLPVYVVVAHVAQLPSDPHAPLGALVPIFAIISAGMAVGSWIHRRRALVAPIQSGQLDPSTPDGRQRAFQPFIINLVLSESVGIYGLVLSFISGQPFYSILFAVAALALMFLHRPTAPDLVPPITRAPSG